MITAVAVFRMNVRLFRTTETALAGLRVRAFRHVHDLSVLHQQGERRGSLVSRVTSDVDQLSVFMQWGGVLGLISVGQLVVATVVMAFYSWQLTLLVLACFVPLAIAVRWFAKRLATAYGVVRERVGDVLGAIAESVVGAPTVRAYGVRARTAARIDAAIDRHYRASVDAQKVTAAVFVTGEFVAAFANAAVVVVGVLLGPGRGDHRPARWSPSCSSSRCSSPRCRRPARCSTRRRTPSPGSAGCSTSSTPSPTSATRRSTTRTTCTQLPAGPLGVRFDHVSFRYAPGARLALDDVDLTVEPRRRVAIVGETGSGKTTFAKLVTRLMDPVEGRVLLGSDAAGWVPLDEVAFASLRSRVVMVPQDGFLFDATVADNVRYGRPGMTDARGRRSPSRSSASAPGSRASPTASRTPVGQRGESLSAGERQLVAVARAYVADPDLLVLDEATSAVDPATEQRLTRALDRSPTAGRRSPSRTGCPPPSGPTRSWSSTPATSSSAGRTPSWSTPRVPTRGCTPPGAAPRPGSPRRRSEHAASAREASYAARHAVVLVALPGPGATFAPPGTAARERRDRPPGTPPGRPVRRRLRTAADRRGPLAGLAAGGAGPRVRPVPRRPVAPGGRRRRRLRPGPPGRRWGWVVLAVAAVLPLLALLGLVFLLGAFGAGSADVGRRRCSWSAR